MATQIKVWPEIVSHASIGQPCIKSYIYKNRRAIVTCCHGMEWLEGNSFAPSMFNTPACAECCLGKCDYDADTL